MSHLRAPGCSTGSERQGASSPPHGTPGIPLEMVTVLDAIPSPVMLLDRERRIIHHNSEALRLLRAGDLSSSSGCRTGEFMGCIHAARGEGGCGATEFCQICGAARAIRAAEQGSRAEGECSITRKDFEEPLDLRVTASPLSIGGIAHTLLAVVDISHEKRRRVLERVFFHDVLNTAAGIQGFAELLADPHDTGCSEHGIAIRRLATRLVEEIEDQKTLAAAESAELSPSPGDVIPGALLAELVKEYAPGDVGRGRHVVIEEATDVGMRTDQALLRRVLSNLLKNALEASHPGDTVTLGARPSGDDHVEFWVHNARPLPRESQLQLFQRSFTTKGIGRGLGTYSVKLLTERYLSGTVSFTSAESEGTTFRVRYPLMWG